MFCCETWYEPTSRTVRIGEPSSATAWCPKRGSGRGTCQPSRRVAANAARHARPEDKPAKPAAAPAAAQPAAVA